MTTVRIHAVGDVMLGDDDLTLGFGIGSAIVRRGPGVVFEQVSSQLSQADIVFGNLEAPISADSVAKVKRPILAPVDALESLKHAGFNVLNLANNHILEHGSERMMATYQALESRGIMAIGVGATKEESRRARIKEICGLKLAFLSYCLVKDKTAFLSVDGTDEISEDVREARKAGNIVVVSLHWGTEYEGIPSAAQRVLAHQVIDAGAHLIVGHHPHVLQGVEKYHGGLIAYSLGNFVFGMNYVRQTRQSAILCCTLSEKGVVEHQVLPVYADDDGFPSFPAGKMDSDLRDKTTRLSLVLVTGSEEGHGLDEIRSQGLLRSRVRVAMISQFLTHWYRYPPSFTIRTVAGYLHKLPTKRN